MAQRVLEELELEADDPLNLSLAELVQSTYENAPDENAPESEDEGRRVAHASAVLKNAVPAWMKRDKERRRYVDASFFEAMEKYVLQAGFNTPESFGQESVLSASPFLQPIEAQQPSDARMDRDTFFRALAFCDVPETQSAWLSKHLSSTVAEIFRGLNLFFANNFASLMN